MPNLNRVHLIGHLLRDPETRQFAGGSVTAFGLGITRKFKKNDGSDGEEKCFVDCDAWGRLGEVVNEFCSKGDPLYVEGRLKLDQWEDKDGNKRSKLKVVAESVQFLQGRQGGDRRPQRQAEPVGVREEDFPF